MNVSVLHSYKQIVDKTILCNLVFLHRRLGPGVCILSDPCCRPRPPQGQGCLPLDQLLQKTRIGPHPGPDCPHVTPGRAQVTIISETCYHQHMPHVIIRTIVVTNYSNSNIQIVLFGIRSFSKNRIYLVFGIQTFLEN